jgi:hypothetical protein
MTKMVEAEAESIEIKNLISQADKLKSEVNDLSRSLGRASNGLS